MGSDVLAGVVCLVGAASVVVTVAEDTGMAPARRRARVAFAAGAVVCAVGNFAGVTAIVVAGGVVALAAIVASVAARYGPARR